MSNPNLPSAQYDMEGDPTYNWAVPAGVISDGIEFVPLEEQPELGSSEVNELRYGYGPSSSGGSEV